MSGRHRQTGTTPARRALLGTVPLVGGAGVVGGLMVGAAPQPETPVAVAETAPATPAGGMVTTASVTLPGKGETAMDVVAGARDAVSAEEAAAAGDAARTADEVSTVARELREQAEQRAEEARADGDAVLAAFHRQQAQVQQRAEESSRPVVPAPAPDGMDPGAECTSDDLLELGPLTLTGPDTPECGIDPWIAGQLEDARD